MAQGKYLAYYLLVWINVIAAAIALAILGITLNIMYGTGIGVASLSGMPVDIYYAVIAFSGLVFVISVLGVLGGCRHSRCATILFTILDFLASVFVIVVMILVLLYANGKSTTPLIDNSFTKVEGTLESQLVTQALDHPDVWLVTQSDFNCCGIDFQSTYDYLNQTKYNDTEFQNMLEPGSNCAAGRAAIASLHEQFPTFSTAANTTAAGTSALQSYFCKAVIENFIHVNTIYVGVIAGVLVLIQLITLVSAFRLLCSITTTHGGFVPPPPDETGGSLAHGGPQFGVANGGALA